jgi:hypothetical protein
MAGEPGVTQARYSSKLPLNIPKSQWESGQKAALIIAGSRRSSPRATRAIQSRILSRASRALNASVLPSKVRLLPDIVCLCSLMPLITSGIKIALD